MDTTKVFMHGFEINVRVEIAYQDIEIISECMGGDCYQLNELSAQLAPKIVLDIGGHIGSFGLMAKRAWPDCRLIAVEPCKDSYELYCMNLKDNGFEGEVINAAISYDKDRTVLLSASRTSGGNVLLSKADAEKYAGEQYRQYDSVYEPVDKFLTIEELTKDIDVIDLAKWDCEGAEIHAFRDMLPETAAKFRTMIGEYHLWGKGKRILEASPLDAEMFWRTTKKKFPHLTFNWSPTVSMQGAALVMGCYGDKYGKFQAWLTDWQKE